MKYIFIILLVLTGISMKAQDLILTVDDRLIEVKIVKVESVFTFYKVIGSPEVKIIRNEKIQGIRWSKQLTEKEKSEILGSNHIASLNDYNEIQYVVVGNERAVSKGFGIATAVFGVTTILLFSAASRSNDSVSGILLGLLGVVTAGVTIVLGVVSLATLGTKTPAKIEKRNIDLGFTPFSTDTNRLLEKQYAHNAYLSGSARGFGIQLNF